MGGLSLVKTDLNIRWSWYTYFYQPSVFSLALLTIVWMGSEVFQCFVLYFWYDCFLTVMNMSASMCENNRNWCAISFDVKYYLDLDYEVWFQFSNIWPVLFKVYQPSHLKIIRIRSLTLPSPVVHHVWFVI